MTRREEGATDGGGIAANKEDVATQGEIQEEEGQKAKGVTQPRKPSQAEIDEHELTHIPCRNWCIHCVKGRGVCDAHRTKGSGEKENGDEDAMITWSLDYAFLTQDDDLVGRKVMETMEPEKVKATVLVCHDSKSGGINAHVVKSKGVGDTWISGRIINDLEDFGY